MEELKEAGLTENEAKVYSALIELGPSFAGEISKKTGLHRRTIYDIIETLIRKGLASFILQNKKKLFQASNPQKILEIIHEKEIILNQVVEELKEKFNKTRKETEASFYKGKEGLKTIFEDQLNSKEILILGASPKAYEILQFYFKWYDKKRKQRKIKARIITHDKEIKKIPLGEIKYLPEKYSSHIAINIYNDKTAIILWIKEPIAILIKNKEIAEGYKNYFELMWKIAK